MAYELADRIEEETVVTMVKTDYSERIKSIASMASDQWELADRTEGERLP
jgi:hypothetical protein